MLKLKSLKFGRIGRFVEPQMIPFDELGNLVQVDGQNNNTGGSSGSGKSTVFNAHDYLLGLNDTPAGILQSRLTAEGIAVSGNYDWDGKNIWITRSKSRGLVIELPGDVVISGNNKLAEEKLDQILGMPRHIFRKMLHKRQKEGGFFLAFTPKEIHEFLTDLLDLSPYRLKLGILTAHYDILFETKTKSDSALLSAKAGLKATEEAIITLGIPPIKDMHPEVVQRHKEKLDTSKAKLSMMESAHELNLKTLELERPKLIAPTANTEQEQTYIRTLSVLLGNMNDLSLKEKDRQAGINAEIYELKSKKRNLDYQIVSGLAAKKEVERIVFEIKKIRSNECPTCEQSWTTESAKTKEARLIEELKGLKQAMTMGEEATKIIEDIGGRISQLTIDSAPLVPEGMEDLKNKEKIISHLLVKEREKNRTVLAEQGKLNSDLQKDFLEKERTLRYNQTVERNSLSGQVDVDRRVFEAALSKLSAYENASKRYADTFAQLVEKEAQYRYQVEKELSIAKHIENKMLNNKDSARAIKSYMSCMFEGALESIGEMATRIIRSIPNMSNATIQLEGTRETQEGKIKEEVNAVISVDGELGIPIKSLSGGERSSVDLAVDLAVIYLIELETGKGIDVFILDEPFTGLGTVEIEMALEVIKNSNINKRIIIVDHNPEVKQMVESRLLVVRDGLTSTITKGAIDVRPATN
jgi:DNA repair exonuclease SbcCD ATPase subunit